ncbi:MAG: ABC transporter substrate-binding protein [Erysipelotrichaceae bacterium]|nr:ABC transporter substrate-binding protein [Erysipelotrichaceae bacterium]
MKKIVLLLVTLMMVITLGACSSKKENNVSNENNEAVVLNVFNWGEYIGEDVIENFEKKFNVKVNYSLFDSNEMLYTKLKNGDSYDVIVPADYMVERLIKEDMLQPLDYSYMTNLANLDERALAIRDQIDKDGVYTLPYFVATAGIVYDKTKVSLEELEEQGWAILKNEKYAGDVFIYDSERDAFMMALKNLGYSANTENMDEINEAYNWLMELTDKMNAAIVTDEVIDAMAGGEKALSFAYSGDAAYIISVNENMGFFMPNEGSRLAYDGLAIPKNANNVELANEFINFMLEYESALDNSLTVGYTSTDKRVLEELTAEGGDFEGNNAYLFDLANPNNELFNDNATMKEALSELWVKVKVK